MVVLLPDDGMFDAFDASITAERFDEIVESMVNEQVALGLPRFEFDYAASLVTPLRALGMTDAFDGELADFSGITGDRDLVISEILHKAFVSVDEAGTEAAAATAVLFRTTGIPKEPIQVIVDRPFLFVLRDRPTGTVLFIGRVLEP
jgi:serpin B